MVHVKISYSVYSDSMTICIDGKPIPPVSRLTRFQTMPFSRWCTEIFNAVSEEVNDIFDLTYIGRACESSFLRNYMSAVPSCVSYASRQPEIPDSALTRLKKLSYLCQSGAKCERFTLSVPIYTDISDEKVREIFNSCLPKLAYCRIGVKIYPLSEAAKHSGECAGFVLSSKPPTSLPIRDCSSPICALCIDKIGAFAECRNNWFIENVHPSNLGNRLKDYLELLLFPFVLRRALQRTEIHETSPHYLPVFVLDKTEPQTVVTLPTSIEFGETAVVKTRTIPEDFPPADVAYRISDETVIAQTSNGFKAVGTGEAVVEAYISGQASPIAVGKITAYRRNRIQKLDVAPKRIELSVGDSATLSYTFSPSDADDVSAIQIASSDGSVVAPQHGMTVIARRPGSCNITVRSEKAADSCNIRVYPRLERLGIQMTNTRPIEGEIAPAEILRTPADATLDKLSFQVDPPSLGIYDMSTRSFLAKTPGRGTLKVFSADHKDIMAAQDIEVLRNIPPVYKSKLFPVALIGLILLILYILFFH